ncbi:SAM-dependent methyltransferase [Planctomycetota bacterium]
MDLRPSRYLRFFGGRRRLYLYHDLNGAVIGATEPLLQVLAPLVPSAAAWRETGAVAGEDEVAGARERLIRWRFLVPPDLDERAELGRWYPLRSVWAVFYVRPERNILRVRYDQRTEKPVIEELDALESLLWRACDGTQPLTALLPDGGDGAGEILEILGRWTRSDCQHLKWLPQPISSYSSPPSEVLSHAKHLDGHGDTPSQPPQECDRDLRDYHRCTIRDSHEQFDWRETTISHLYRVPHPALGGRTYGGRLVEVLSERRLLRRSHRLLVEVGGGTGEMAACVLEALREGAPDLFANLTYTIVDLAPALVAGQRRTLAQRLGADVRRVRWLQGSAEELPLAASTVDLVLSNEVIADLSVDRDPAAGGLVNSGALRFLEEIARVLAPGGGAFVSEYGELGAEVKAADGLDHAEHTINFQSMLTRAEGLSLQVALEPLGDLFRFDVTVPIFLADGIQFAEIRALARLANKDLPVLAYTPAMLAETLGDALDLDRLFNLNFSTLGQFPYAGLAPNAFKVLLLRKPEQEPASLAQ